MVRCHISVHSLPSELFSLSLVILSPHTDLTVHYVTLGFKFDIQSCHQWSMVNEKKKHLSTGVTTVFIPLGILEK